MVINKLLEWAKCEKNIRAIILSGSRAKNTYDELSDYDLSLICTDVNFFICDDAWLSKIGKVWICVHEKVFIRKKEFLSRLVIFEKGIKIDFSFYPIESLNDVKNLLFRNDHQILLNKETSALSIPDHKERISAVLKPNREQYLTIVKEFWFEAYHVAVYLRRGDLWSAQFRFKGLHHQFLLQMIEWNELSKTNWKSPLPELGKRMQSWISKETWEALHQSFAHFDEKDSWQALESTIKLFRTLAYQTASNLGFTYCVEVDQNISEFIDVLKVNGEISPCFDKI